MSDLAIHRDPRRWEEVTLDDDASSVTLPTGTVTFLLTDVEGSTRLWETAPDTAGSAVTRHYEILDRLVAAHGGVRPVEQGEGDSVVAAFSFATDAVAAAIEMQSTLRAEVPELAVRMAIHTGETQLRDSHNYMGDAVIRCARLRATAHGGQIVLSDTAAGLVASHLPAGTGLRDLGVHRLRDVSRPERVWQLVGDALPDHFPPLRTLDHFRHNLPAAATPLVGRAHELADVRRLMRTRRIVTITGAGGVGKTRIAQHVAAELVDDFPDGVWWVDLAPISDDDRVGIVLANAVGLSEVPGQTAIDEVVAALRESSTLLVIDNCEHVVEPVALTIDRVLAECPSVSVLATSREPLGLGGEHTWRAPSMNERDATSLFVERARQARSNFAVGDDNAAVVAQICERLDGIPLALELAAARVRTLPVDRLAAELDQRFRILTGGTRTALPRQRTLLASVDWSYELLEDRERVVLRRLAAFAGGFTLDAAETVCSDERLDAYDVLQFLTQLVDKSLVQLDEQSGRYRLLETIRRYAIDCATAAGELSAIRDRHLRWCLELAGQWGLDHRLPTFSLADEIDGEYDNLLSALGWAIGSESAVTLLHPLAAVWTARSRLTDCVVWSDRVLDALQAGSGPWARGVAAVVRPRTVVGDLGFNITVVDRAIAAAEDFADTWSLTRLLSNNPIYRSLVRPETDVVGEFDRAIALAIESGDEPGELLATAIAAHIVAGTGRLGLLVAISSASTGELATTGWARTSSLWRRPRSPTPWVTSAVRWMSCADALSACRRSTAR